MSDIFIDPPETAPQPNEPTGAEAPRPVIDLGPDGNPQGAAQPSPADDLIKESDTNGFMADVIEASQSVPVIVDLWAPWCGPCKTLGPMLERLVKRAGGLVKMVKINVDENQGLAQQLRVQSIPTVFAFKGGQPVDAFMGAQSEGQIQAFIDRLIGDAQSPLDQAMDDAQVHLSNGQAGEAESIYGAILDQDPSYVPALAGMIRAIAEQGEFDRAQEIVAALDAATRAHSDIEQAVSALELAQNSAGADTAHLDDLAAKVEAEPKNLEARLELANALIAARRYEDAIEHLLDIVSRDRAWNDEAGRKQLLKVFDTLGPTDPLTRDARRRLSAVLFS